MTALGTLIKIFVIFVIVRFIMKTLFGSYIDRKKREYVKKKETDKLRFKSSEKIDDADFEDIK